MCSLEVYIKSFGGQKGGSFPRTPPAYGPDNEGVYDDERASDMSELLLCTCK